MKKVLKQVKSDYCAKPYDPKNVKVRHHDYNIHPTYVNGILQTGNFLNPICSRYNIQITIKNYTIPVIAHNSSRYDKKYVISSIDDSFSSPFIVTQGGENFISISVEKARVKTREIFLMVTRRRNLFQILE